MTVEPSLGRPDAVAVERAAARVLDAGRELGVPVHAGLLDDAVECFEFTLRGRHREASRRRQVERLFESKGCRLLRADDEGTEQCSRQPERPKMSSHRISQG